MTLSTASLTASKAGMSQPSSGIKTAIKTTDPNNKTSSTNQSEAEENKPLQTTKELSEADQKRAAELAAKRGLTTTNVKDKKEEVKKTTDNPKIADSAWQDQGARTDPTTNTETSRFDQAKAAGLKDGLKHSPEDVAEKYGFKTPGDSAGGSSADAGTSASGQGAVGPAQGQALAGGGFGGGGNNYGIINNGIINGAVNNGVIRDNAINSGVINNSAVNNGSLVSNNNPVINGNSGNGGISEPGTSTMPEPGVPQSDYDPSHGGW